MTNTERRLFDILSRAVSDYYSTDPEGGWVQDAESLIDEIGDEEEQRMLDDVEAHERAMFAREWVTP